MFPKFRMTCKKGEVKWVRFTARLYGSQVITTFEDITKRKENLELLNKLQTAKEYAKFSLNNRFHRNY